MTGGQKHVAEMQRAIVDYIKWYTKDTPKVAVMTITITMVIMLFDVAISHTLTLVSPEEPLASVLVAWIMAGSALIIGFCVYYSLFRCRRPPCGRCCPCKLEIDWPVPSEIESASAKALAEAKQSPV